MHKKFCNLLFSYLSKIMQLFIFLARTFFKFLFARLVQLYEHFSAGEMLVPAWFESHSNSFYVAIKHIFIGWIIGWISWMINRAENLIFSKNCHLCGHFALKNWSTFSRIVLVRLRGGGWWGSAICICIVSVSISISLTVFVTVFALVPFSEKWFECIESVNNNFNQPKRFAGLLPPLSP